MNKASYVDPIIGTVGDEQEQSFHGGGKTHPGATVPGGMVQLSPDTCTCGDNGTGYNYCQSTIEGFSINHMSGIGWYGDLGNLQIMPTVGETDLRSGTNAEVPFNKGSLGWRSEFSHSDECAKAGYYSVLLKRYGIFAEATASLHTGTLRFTYPVGSDRRVILNLSRRIAGHADSQSVNIVNDRRIEGHIHCTPKGGGFGRGSGKISYDLFFVLEFSESASGLRFFENEEYLPEALTSATGTDLELTASFGKTADRPLEINIGISYVDIEGARNNFETECIFGFDRKAAEASAQWEKALDVITVDGADKTGLTLFYTCLYHTLLDPRTATDCDGRFKIGEAVFKEDYTQRTMFSGWDVYRSEFPLLTLISPDTVNDEINSLLKIATEKNTSLPRWELMGNDSGCMVGEPGLLVTADAYLKGIRGFDAQKAFSICKASADGETEAFGRQFKSLRPSSNRYKRNAYVPGSLSETLEFLLADYCLARFAGSLGKTDDAEHFMGRAAKYPENFYFASGFNLPRDENGDFLSFKDEYDTVGCVESNIFQQSWFVPFDVEGLSKLYGPERNFELLERLFEKADFSALWNENYNHSNEPCHNLTHYFSLLGSPHRTQYWTRRVQTEAYRTGAFGFCGNEDVGQLSAWYVLSALGLAQVCIGFDAYVFNTPLFRKIELKLSEGYHSRSVSDRLLIECDREPLEYPYIKSVTFNGKRINHCYIKYSELTLGGVLKFELSKDPCPDAFTEPPESFMQI